MTDDSLPQPMPVEAVEELPHPELPGVVHPGWLDRFPWLVQGTTGAGDAEGPFDLGLFSDASSPRDVLARWDLLRTTTGLPRATHARQVHGSAVRWHHGGPPGLHLVEPCDGHGTSDAGLLLAVSTADCVPVSVVDARGRAVALVHAGWRGTAAGILERGVAVLGERAASRPEDLHVHLGPAICGACYEVGPEVFQALDLPAPSAPAPVDLRGALARRAVAAGVPADCITVSTHCTRCGGGFFSHRRGDRARQVGFLGIRAP